jgi:hypothetical protein
MDADGIDRSRQAVELPVGARVVRMGIDRVERHVDEPAGGELGRWRFPGNGAGFR